MNLRLEMSLKRLRLAQNLVTQKKHPRRGFSTRAMIFKSVRTGQKNVDVGHGVKFVELPLQFFMNRFQGVRFPEAACKRRLVCDDAYKIPRSIEIPDHRGCTLKQDNFIRAVHVAGFPPVDDAVPVQEGNGGTAAFAGLWRNGQLNIRPLHGRGL